MSKKTQHKTDSNSVFLEWLGYTHQKRRGKIQTGENHVRQGLSKVFVFYIHSREISLVPYIWVKWIFRCIVDHDGAESEDDIPDTSYYQVSWSYVKVLISIKVTYDLSFASTETKFIKPKTKTQNNFLVNTGFLVKFFQKKPK